MASSAALTTTHLPRLRAGLEEWRKKQSLHAEFATPLSEITNRANGGGQRKQQGKDVVVAFRTRPPLENEAETKFAAAETQDAKTAEGAEEQADTPQSAFCAGITVKSAEPGEFVAHVPGMKAPQWSGPTLAHKTFVSDLAFGPDVDNEEVYQRAVITDDLLTLALSGGIACILAYGQTGAGKTYTMEALEHRIARDLFSVAKTIGRQMRESEKRGAASEADQVASDTNSEEEIFEFSATFLELLGKRAVDLLEPADGLPVDAQGNPIRKEVPIQEDKSGDVRPRLISTVFRSSEELEGLITAALAHRRTSATARNAASSRSHAILTVRIKNKLLPYAEEGQLILADLAGSERYEDSKAHDKQRMDESRENNKSLMNLKECVRAKARMANEDGFVHIPWRMSKLTVLLKPIFDPESRQASRTLIIAHVSPHIQDSTHSVNTLSYAAPFKTSPPKPRGPAPYDPTDPRTWNTEQTREWLTAEFTKRARAREAAARKVAEKSAARRGKTPPPAELDGPVRLAVDVERLCQEGMTALHFGRMYTTEFVQRCMEVANMGGEVTPDVVRNAAAIVFGMMTYLTMTAKTRTRNDIIKSRKRLALDEVYGGISRARKIAKANLAIPASPVLQIYTDDEIAQVAESMGSRWAETINEAVAKGETRWVDAWDAEVAAINGMMESWRAANKG
ncbi:nucleoside triphosphate hydrolase protein [Wolfiporia cocos MD-104 SS10]|uniref:Nucleoside triphosphate hydrolase protein n=1 Tax=Wolfiporia cocos (strain MD-104) TaxID=742152 RepID=A0A2H3JG72_WOLCO|nr:nucleoside triphosphate hydrolase protein [Wolfiporia cocos MD-104 SS10]